MSETQQHSTKLQPEPVADQTKPMRPIMVVTIRGVAFRAAWGSKRAYILQSLAAEEAQVSLPWALVLFCGICFGAGLTALIDWLL